MRHYVKRALCLLVSLSILLTVTAIFTFSTTAVTGSKEPMIAVGDKFIIVQTASGEIWGWGDNATGVLGTAFSTETKTNITSPTQITLPVGVTSVSVSAGFDHVLMLGSDGNVYAWGNNEEGQLGLSDTTSPITTPTLVEGLRNKNIIAVAAGARFSLALTDGGSVYSFGRNTLHQLGYDTSLTFLATPERIESLNGIFITQICAGTDSAIALDKSDKAYLWGSTDNYLLGIDRSPNSTLPFAMPESKTTTPILSAGISASHSAFLLNDGTVGFMGCNNYGQYGNEETDSSPSKRFRLTDTATLGVCDIALSEQQTVLLTTSGKVYTAGARIPNNQDSASNVFVPLFEEGTKAPVAFAIAAKYQNGAMIAQDGSVWTWGDNSRGQLGNGSVSNGQATPVKVALSAGTDFDMGQAPNIADMPIKITTSVPAPTFAIVIPSVINVGELRQTDEADPERTSLTKFTVEAQNVNYLFGEKEIQISVNTKDPNGVFYLQDESGAILPFDLLAAKDAQTPIANGDVFATFTENGSVDTWIRIDQSKIVQSGIYNGVLVFSYSVVDIEDKEE